MVVGIGIVTLYIPENFSLKGKRQVVKSIIEKVKNRFNVSIAEVADNDIWQTAKIGFSLTGNDHSYINSKIDKILNFISSAGTVEIREQDFEIIHFKEG